MPYYRHNGEIPDGKRPSCAGCSDFVTRWKGVNGASKKLGQTSNKQSNHAVAVWPRREALVKYFVIGTVLFGISVVWGARYFGKLFKVAGNDGARVRPERAERAVSALFL